MMGLPGLSRALLAFTATAVLVGAELDRRPDLAARIWRASAMAEAPALLPRHQLFATGTTELVRRLAAGELDGARALATHLAALAPEVGSAAQGGARDATVPALSELLVALDAAERGRRVALVLGDLAVSLDRGPQERLALADRKVFFQALARVDLDRRYRAATDGELDVVLELMGQEPRPFVLASLVAWVGRIAQERTARWLVGIATDEARGHDVRAAALEALARIDRGRPVKISALALEPLAVRDGSPLAGLALDACVRLHHNEAAAAMHRVLASLDHQAAHTLRGRLAHYANAQRQAALRLLAERRPAEAVFAARPLRMLAPGVAPAVEARCRALAGSPADAVRLLLPFDDPTSTAHTVAVLSALPWSAVRALMDEADDEPARARWAALRRRLPHLEARRDP